MNKEWLRAASIRALKTFAQTAGSVITVGATLTDVDWKYVGSVSIVAAIYSIITSISGLPEVKKEDDKNE